MPQLSPKTKAFVVGHPAAGALQFGGLRAKLLGAIGKAFARRARELIEEIRPHH